MREAFFFESSKLLIRNWMVFKVGFMYCKDRRGGPARALSKWYYRSLFQQANQSNPVLHNTRRITAHAAKIMPKNQNNFTPVIQNDRTIPEHRYSLLHAPLRYSVSTKSHFSVLNYFCVSWNCQVARNDGFKHGCLILIEIRHPRLNHHIFLPALGKKIISGQSFYYDWVYVEQGRN